MAVDVQYVITRTVRTYEPIIDVLNLQVVELTARTFTQLPSSPDPKIVSPLSSAHPHKYNTFEIEYRAIVYRFVNSHTLRNTVTTKSEVVLFQTFLETCSSDWYSSKLI